MTSRAGPLFVIVAACALGSCESQKAPPPRVQDENATLGGEIAAQVGGEKIPLHLVASVAKKQKISPREAARKVIDDAIAAQAAKARGLDQQPPAAWLLVAARGRFAADKIFEEARKAGPPTDEEVNVLSEVYWHEVDRPPTIRVVHAVAQPKKPENEAAARAVAVAIRAAVDDATSAEDFLAKAKTVVAPPEVNVIAQPLPAFTQDGWSSEMENGVDPVFAKGAFALSLIGATSQPYKTQFGFHVVRLVERMPEHRLPFETRRTMFTDEAAKLRARNSTKRRIQALRAAHRIEVSTAAESLMRSVPISER